MEAIINEETGNTEINGVSVSQDKEHEIEYSLRNREQQIEDLYKWIAESQSESDKTLMKEDLHYLESLNDEFIFSNLSTNEFIAQSDDEETFNKICQDLLN